MSDPPSDLSDLHRINEKSVLIYGNVEYTLRPMKIGLGEQMCVFFLGDDEELRRTVRLSNDKTVNFERFHRKISDTPCKEYYGCSGEKNCSHCCFIQYF